MRVSTIARDVVFAAVTPPNAGLLGSVSAGCQVCLEADDRLNACVVSGGEEFVSTVHVSVVGHSHGRHFLRCNLFYQLLDFGSAVEHRIIGVNVKVNK